MTEDFWLGFDKKAAASEMPSVISEWAKEDRDEADRVLAASKMETKIDPRELSEFMGPEAWYRWGWP
jgi:hypothetical protein